MPHPRRRLLAAIVVGTTTLFAPAFAQQAPDRLLTGFQTPPNSARPRTWWHWTGGNITLDGIDKDTAWMKRVGIGGFQIADVAYGAGQSIEKKVYFGSPAWLGALKHAANDADKLGLEMSIFSSPGWSEAGGPWVTPDKAMKRLVWSETEIVGGRPFSGVLPMPPDNQGPVRDLVTGKQPAHGFYRDAVVLAYRVPAATTDALPKFTSSAGAIDGSKLTDDSLNTSITIDPAVNGPTWIEMTYARPFTARAMSLGQHGGIPVGKLEASDDGINWRTIVVTPGPQGYHGAEIRTYAFPAVTARHFRLQLSGAPIKPAQVIDWGPIEPAKSFELTELKLFSTGRVARWEDKGAFGSLMDDYDGVPTPSAPADATIQDVVNLTSKMKADGTLHWTPPAGRWKVVRFGYADTGATNHPAVPSGQGLEVDKFNPVYVADYLHGYLDPIQKALGPSFGHHPSYITMDSWEAGMQNWTDDMIAQFKRRRGYDPTPYLPVLAGHIVKNADISDRFLWDFRRTLADMYADDFYGTMEAELNKRGLKTYAEASGVALEIPEDTLLNKSKVDIPMAEFWVHHLHPQSEYYVDVRQAASAGHVFGKPIVAAEAFTGGWYEAPYTLKKVADYWFAQGINRLVFHSTAIQPLDTKPGNTMVGTHLNRNITWAEEAKPFMDYVARNDYMLQQGRFVADVAYLLPEGAPSTQPFWGAGLTPELPKGYDYDVINTDVLLHDATVGSDGRIHLPSGMSYRVLVLPPTTRMSVAVIDKIAELVRAGAWIVGPRPRHSTGLAGYPQSEATVKQVAETLWGGLDGIANNQRQVGKGMVTWGLPLDRVLDQAGVAPDVQIASPIGDSVVWLHRALPGGDVYYIASQADSPQHIEARFRVTGKAPELWDPMTGRTRPASYTIANGATTVPLDLGTRQSLYVVFRKPAETTSRSIKPPVVTTIDTLGGPWQLRFSPGPGAPSAPMTLPDLMSWTDSDDPMVHYFSGTGVYTHAIDVTPEQLANGHVVLDLGDVRDIAEVRVNGADQGLVWAPPYKVDITKGLHAGHNTLEIRVTNEWTNRIEGDKNLPGGRKVLPAAAKIRRFFSTGKEPLPKSGLLGPVTVLHESD